MPLTITFCISLFLSIALVPIFIRHAARLGLIDSPDGVRKIHSTSIPRCGGIAIALSTLIPSIYFSQFLPIHNSFIFACLIIIFFGVLDDRFNLHYKWKFGGQIAAGIIALFALPDLSRLPFFIDPDNWAWLGYIGIFFYLIAATNAVNLSDGLDGLAGGTILLSLALIAYLAWTLGIEQVALIALAVIGSLLGFLRYNTHPAKVFMGDTGSQFIGFTTAVLSILLTQDLNCPMSPLLPILILGLPLIDTAMVMSLRIKQGRSPFSADKSHIHHQLIQLGFRHYEAVAIIYIIQIIFIVLALLLRYESDSVILLAYTTCAGIILSSLYYLNQTHWNFRSANENTNKWRGKLTHNLSSLRHYSPYIVLSFLVFIWLYPAIISTGFYGQSTSTIALLAFIANILFIKFRRYQLAIRTVTYFNCVFAVYTSWHNTQIMLDPAIINVATLGVVVSLSISVLVTRREEFSLDNQDILILALLLGASTLPLLTKVDFIAGEMMVKLVVMFYAVEYLINCLAKQRVLLQGTSCLTLLLYVFGF